MGFAGGTGTKGRRAGPCWRCLREGAESYAKVKHVLRRRRGRCTPPTNVPRARSTAAASCSVARIRRAAVRGTLERGNPPARARQRLPARRWRVPAVRRSPPTTPRWRGRRQGRRIPAARSSKRSVKSAWTCGWPSRPRSTVHGSTLSTCPRVHGGLGSSGLIHSQIVHGTVHGRRESSINC